MELKLTTEYLQELIEYEGASLVGKLLKRFEIIHNTDILKSSVKELVYEEFRHLRDLLIAGGRGLEQTHFTFKSKPKGKV